MAHTHTQTIVELIQGYCYIEFGIRSDSNYIYINIHKIYVHLCKINSTCWSGAHSSFCWRAQIQLLVWAQYVLNGQSEHISTADTGWNRSDWELGHWLSRSFWSIIIVSTRIEYRICLAMITVHTFEFETMTVYGFIYIWIVIQVHLNIYIYKFTHNKYMYVYECTLCCKRLQATTTIIKRIFRFYCINQPLAIGWSYYGIIILFTLQGFAETRDGHESFLGTWHCGTVCIPIIMLMMMMVMLMSSVGRTSANRKLTPFGRNARASSISNPSTKYYCI